MALFVCTKLFGSENNDEFYVDDNGHVVTRTNFAGGILGGISNGMPITLRVAFKPTPSIAQPQSTVTDGGDDATIEIKGRPDPVIVPRAVVVVETCLSSPTDIHGALYVGAAPCEDFGYLVPIVDVGVFEVLYGSSGDNHAVKLLVTHNFEVAIEGAHVFDRGVFGGMSLDLHEVYLKL